ncbi:PTS sugar transporter subunit IIB [Virgibacillus necropolis]|uniref:PTS sugar transporter subunit IIB n=1 Tax=Virgibacillus necropolis TaxID=163877 RepID=A0A221M9M2_9BACI|nr:PTS sugar transporter subunit IIB [Virgibacillus necropolis]ASN04321.1 PTS sugar transporter subunit IIB [Virgibacillus necropolis]
MGMDKLHILLLCNLGSSTGIMVSKMKEVARNSAKLKKVDINIEAHPAGELREYIDKFDVILLGPQIAHRYDELEAIADQKNTPIGIIDSRDYGSINAGNILKQSIVMKMNK